MGASFLSVEFGREHDNVVVFDTVPLFGTGFISSRKNDPVDCSVEILDGEGNHIVTFLRPPALFLTDHTDNGAVASGNVVRNVNGTEVCAAFPQCTVLFERMMRGVESQVFFFIFEKLFFTPFFERSVFGFW